MIFDSLEQSDLYVSIHPGFEPAFRYLRTLDTTNLKDGRSLIRGDRLYAVFSDGQGKGRAGTRLETHDRYIDIQFTPIIRGTTSPAEDEIGWSARSTCEQRSEGYDAERDIEFYTGGPDAWITLREGFFAVFFPGDAHAPLATEGPVRKVVVKGAVAANWKG